MSADNREPIPKKRRFEIFKRDGFRCSYCGRTPPAVTLQVDHLIAVSSGGKNQPENLVTACRDCNLGKSNRPLDEIPTSLAVSAESLREKEDQISGYKRLLKSIEKRKQKDAELISLIFQGHFPGYRLSADFMEVSLKGMFLEKLPIEDLKFAAQLACERKPYDLSAAVKYFCGIAWNKIRKKG